MTWDRFSLSIVCPSPTERVSSSGKMYYEVGEERGEDWALLTFNIW